MSVFNSPCVPSTSGRHALHHAVPLARLGRWHSGWRSALRNAHLAVVRATSIKEEEEQAAPATENAALIDPPARYVEVGVVGAPHGVYGEMKVQPLTDFPEERLGTPGTRWLRAPPPKIGRRRAPPPTSVELEYGRTSVFKGNVVWIVKLEGVDSPEDAGLLRGHALLIPASARSELEDEDEFYVQDLVGLKVFLQMSAEELGKVVDIFDGTGTHDVLRIQLLAPPQAEGEEKVPPKYVLLPFAKELVPVVDVGAGRMEIVPPEGLLELAVAPAAKKERKENKGRKERRRGGRPNSNSSEAAAAATGGERQPGAAGEADE